MKRLTPDQAMVDAIRTMFGLRPLYASEERSIEIRMARAMSGAFTDGNFQRKHGETSHGGSSVLVSR